MPNSPRVSIIVPNYNHAPFLRERLESVFNQTFRDFEVILLDDASTDASVVILEDYAKRPNTRLVINQQNSGSPFKQWNKGVRMAAGEFIWIAESDDVAEPTFLEVAMATFSRRPGCGLFFCRSRLMDADGALGELSRLDMVERRGTCCWERDGRTFVRKHMMRFNTITNASGVVVRRSFYEAAGMAPEDWLFCGDWLFWCRLCALTRVAYVPDCLNYHRLHQGGLTINTKAKERRLIESYQARNVIYRECRYAWLLQQQEWNRLAGMVVNEYGLIWNKEAIIPSAFQSYDPLFALRVAIYRVFVRVQTRLARWSCEHRLVFREK